ncbi:MAG: hypothetical protein H0X26_02005 [Alphaproteobacteria bacterium]|nr:hypothetical protein [Alphaproteobacteria bacterium]
MTITYRAEKGSPLTAREIDDNFRELETRLAAIADNPEGGESLGKIQVEGDQIHFRGTFGANFGTFTLPKASLNPRGPWLPQTPYKKLDVVTIQNAAENSLSCCIADHISNVWAQDSSFWKSLLSFPQPPPSTMALYEKASLPESELMGKLALLMEEKGPALIFFNGNNWQRLMQGENL